jgi:hypothetical protein
MREPLETGGVSAGSPGETLVSEIGFAGVVGIVRRWNLFQISAKALDGLFTYADDSDLWIPVQFHSHQSRAFISPRSASAICDTIRACGQTS